MPTEALMRVVKAAIAVRQRDMTRASGASVHAYNELLSAVDALAMIGAVAEIEQIDGAENSVFVGSPELITDRMEHVWGTGWDDFESGVPLSDNPHSGEYLTLWKYGWLQASSVKKTPTSP